MDVSSLIEELQEEMSDRLEREEFESRSVSSEVC